MELILTANLVRQVRTAYFTGAAQHKSMGNGVFQLPYISRPWIGHQCFHGIRGHIADIHALVLVSLFNEAADQQRDILQALPQRRKPMGNTLSR